MTDVIAHLLLVAFTPFPAPTGASTRLAQRIVALSNAGYAVDVLTPKTADLPHVSKYLNARIFRVPMPQHRDSLPGVVRPKPDDPLAPATHAQRVAAFERAIRRQLQASEYDAVYLLDPYAWPAMEAAADDLPILYESATDQSSLGTDTQWLTTFLERETEAIRKASAVLVPTNEAARRAHVVGAGPGSTYVVRPCADSTLFQPPADGRRRRPKPLRIAVAASSLMPQELSLLAEALLILPREVDVRVIVSAAVTPDARTRLLTESVLSDRLTLRDPVLYDDLAPFYQDADIGLVVSSGRNPGRSEGARLQTIVEMMATGLPTLLPDIPPIREIVAHDREAYLVPPADVEALVRGIEALASDPARCRRIGLAARTRAVDALDEKKQSARMLEVLAAVLAASGRAGGRQLLEDQQEFTPASESRAAKSAASSVATVPGRRAAALTEPPPTRAQAALAVDVHEEVTSPDLKLASTALADASRPVETDPAHSPPF